MGKKDTPLVAIWMLAYNHAPFVEQAVEGVMMQRTNFSYKLFLSEDCSSDGTREKCIKLAEKYPEKIDLYLPEKNIGIKGENNIADRTYKRCIESGAKYIALCESDDYWTDTMKLQKQVDFLEANPEYSLCFHDVEKLFDNGRKQLVRNEEEMPFNTEYLIRKGRPCHTCSILFRRDALDMQFLSDCSHFLSGDLAILLNLSLSGNFKNLPETMAVYRVHEKGLTKDHSWRKNLLDSNIDLLNFFNQRSNFRYDALIKKRIGELRLIQLRGAKTLTDKISRLRLIQQEKPDLLLINIDKIAISFFWWFVHKTRLYYLKRWAKKLLGAQKMV